MMTDVEITKLLAEKVMGWEARQVSPICPRPPWTEDPLYWCEHREHPQPTGFQSSMVVHKLVDDWNPLLDDADACAVLDKIFSDGNAWTLTAGPPGGFRTLECVIWPRWIVDGKDRFVAVSEDATGNGRRRAICLAALKAEGVDVDE